MTILDINDPILTPSIHIESALNVLHTLLIEEQLSPITIIQITDAINEIEYAHSKLERGS